VGDVELALGDRVLLIGQTNAQENGIYVVVAEGSLTRAPDMAKGMRVAAGATIRVLSGTYSGQTFVSECPHNADVVGVDILTFTRYYVRPSDLQSVVTKPYVDNLAINATLLNGRTNQQYDVKIGSKMLHATDHFNETFPLNQMDVVHTPYQCKVCATGTLYVIDKTWKKTFIHTKEQ
jgi:hypothetical protein